MTKENLKAATAMILVEIDGSGIEQGRTYVDKATNVTKPLPGKQNAYIWQGGRYPLQVSVDIPEGAAPYRPGTYVLAGSLFESGKYGRIEFKGGRDLKLVPLDLAISALTAVHQEETGEVIELPRTGTKG